PPARPPPPRPPPPTPSPPPPRPTPIFNRFLPPLTPAPTLLLISPVRILPAMIVSSTEKDCATPLSILVPTNSLGLLLSPSVLRAYPSPISSSGPRALLFPQLSPTTPPRPPLSVRSLL